MLSRFTVLGAASAALVALAAPATAAGLDAIAPAPVLAAPVAVTTVTPQPVSSADWTGGYAGVQLSYGSAEVEDVFDDESTGALFGINSGYRYDFGRIVLGGEVSYDRTTITFPNDVDVDDVLRAGVTAGYEVGRILPYVTAGYAGVSLSEEVGGEDRFDGGYYGLGAAYRFTDSVSLSAEVLQHRFDIDTIDADADVTTFGIKAAYQF